MPAIDTIDLRMVNCYLVKSNEGCVLVDTGWSFARRTVDRRVAAAGMPLKLIVITHGDIDHIGNAAYLHEKYGAPIVMHQADAAMAAQGDMFAGRKPIGGFFRTVVAPLFRLRPRDRFMPHTFLQDGDSLASWGLAATVLHVPGHSPGSLAVLTSEGDLFCGDLLTRGRVTAEHGPIIDDRPAMRASIERILALPAPPRIIYPGHGASFTWEMLRGVELP